MNYIRIRQRNQVTLPREISSALQVKEGDFLEVSTIENTVILRPTRLVKFGTPEGEEENRRAEQDFKEGRYRTFNSAESFAKSLGVHPKPPISVEAGRNPLEVIEVGRSGKVKLKQLKGVSVKTARRKSLARIITAALDEAGGDAKTAGKRLEQAIKALELSRQQGAEAVK